MSDTPDRGSELPASLAGPVAIAIDGAAASGKSSTAILVARALSIRHLDSGSLYRAVTVVRIRMAGEEPPQWNETAVRWSEASLLEAASHCGIVESPVSFEPTIDGAVVRDELRETVVNSHVSYVARVVAVRDWVNTTVRQIAARHDLVVDGRDIGTTVLPAAGLKIFLVADPWERAKRRLRQHPGGRVPGDEEIAAEVEWLVRRDARDAAQSAPARDAIVIDTTHVSQAEQVERIVALARTVFGDATRHLDVHPLAEPGNS